MNNKTIIIIVVAVVAIICAAGAIVALNPGSYDSGKNNEGKDIVTITDDLGREVELALPIEEIVMPSSDLLRAFIAVAGDDFIDLLTGGLGDLQRADSEFYDILTKNYPAVKNLKSCGIAYGNSGQGGLEIDTIIGLEPELILFPTTTKTYQYISDAQLKAIDNAGIPYVFVDFYTDPYGEGNFQKNIRILGKILQEEERAESVISFFEKQVNAVYDNLPTIKDDERKKVFVDIVGGGGQPSITTQAGVPEIEYTNGYNVAMEMTLPGGFGEPDREKLISIDPDILYICASSWYGHELGTMFGFNANPTDAQLKAAAERYLNENNYNILTAAKENEVYFVYAMFRQDVECFVTLQQMAVMLYPDVFSDLDPDQTLYEFYDKFMPFQITGNWMYKISS